MGYFKRFILIFLGLFLGGAIGVGPYLAKIKEIEQRVQVYINDQIIVADVVRAENERNAGLSGREAMGVNEGMLFLFDEPGRYGFWMKGMKFPIDIIWINGNKVVGIEERAPIAGETRDREIPIYYPPEEVDKVLETVAGRARLLRLAIGDEIRIKAFVPRLEMGK